MVGSTRRGAHVPRKTNNGGTVMDESSALGTARDMIRLHGLRAQAVAMERIAEMRQQGDTRGIHVWEQTYAAIRELRRTAAEASRSATA
jgi:hypothetical protein